MTRIGTARGAIAACGTGLALVLAAGSAMGGAIVLDQGWTAEQRADWYDRSQGSRLLPLSWLRALEQPGSSAAFLDSAYIAGAFRYLPRATPDNPELPVGFAIDTSDDSDLAATKLRWQEDQGEDEPWVGLTCAACHTAKITYGEHALIVDGAPTLADLQKFVGSINAALVETLGDAQKFARFADGVLGKDASKAGAPRLREALGALADHQLAIARMNHTDMEYGFGRMDAVGYILNKVSFLANGPDGAAMAPTAPVSYPQLWDINRLDRLQWNAMVEAKPRSYFGRETIDGGALGRDVAQAIGVFGDVNVERRWLIGGFDWLLQGFDSSIQIANIVDLERQLEHLQPPKWPEAFGPIDAQLRVQGEEVFDRNCAGCHKFSKPAERSRCVEVTKMSLENIETDPWSSCNAYSFHATSGKLSGHCGDYFYGNVLADDAYLTDMLRVTSIGVMTAQLGSLLWQSAAAIFDSDRPARETECMHPVREHPPRTVETDAPVSPEERDASCTAANEAAKEAKQEAVVVYKARPLTGIWATAPYLHNGSVPNLDELLRPVGERSKSFHVGTTEFDPVRVGFVAAATPENTGTFRTRDANGQAIPGNSNAGHDHFRGTDDERRALLEYLKSL